MLNELVITQANYQSQFAGERDVVTHQPYRIGDRVVRCRNCLAIIKTEYVDGSCPMCNTTPFVSVSFHGNASRQGGKHPNVVSPRRNWNYRRPENTTWRRFEPFCRSRRMLMILLVLAVIISGIPLEIRDFRKFIYGIIPDLNLSTAKTVVIGVSAITAVMIACIRRIADYWKYKRSGFLIPLIPVVSPYLLAAICVLAVWAFHALLAVAAVVLSFTFLTWIFA